MPTMPGRVAKTPEWKKFDDAITKSPKAYLAKYTQEPDPAQYVELISNARQDDVIDDVMLRHLLQHWSSVGTDPYFPGVPDLGLHVLQGLRWAAILALYKDKEAMQEERDIPLPVRSVWVCTFPPGSAEFEIVCYESDCQVTLMFLTPQPTSLWPVTGAGLQPVYATRRRFKDAQNQGPAKNWDKAVEEKREKTMKMVTVQPRT